MEYMSKEKLDEMKAIDDFRNRVLKYIVYKKRTEAEVRKKFEDADPNLLEDTIEYLKNLKYINDENYIVRAVDEFMALKNLSIKEMRQKLLTKGIKADLLDEYICKNRDAMIEYEVSSCKKIILKKRKNMDDNLIKNFLYKKGYTSETISISFDDLG